MELFIVKLELYYNSVNLKKNFLVYKDDFKGLSILYVREFFIICNLKCV